MCECRANIETKLTERHAAQQPKGRDHKATLRGYGFVIGAKVSERAFMEYETYALMPLKAGGEKPKKTTGNMYFTYCPFCGKKYE